MINFIRNIPWKEVGIIILLGALALGAVVGIGAAVTNKTKTVSSLEFVRGEVDADGVYAKSDTSIYTKNLIECQGLEITPDFEATGTYQVFYYDTNKLFLGTSGELNASSGGTYKKGQDFPYAKYCRIMITPETPTDDDGLVIEDYKIKFYEVIGIANDFTIVVKKEQKAVQNEDLFANADKNTGVILRANVDGYLEEVPSEQGNDYCGVNLADLYVNTFKVTFEKVPGALSYIFVTDDNKVASQGSFNGDDTTYMLSVPDNAVTLVIIYKPDNVPSIYRAG